MKNQKKPFKSDNQGGLDLSRFTLPSKEESQTETTDNTSFTVNPEAIESPKESSFGGTTAGKMWIAGFIGLILVAIVGSFFVFRLGTKNQIQSNSEVLIPSPSPAVTPSPSPSVINKSEYKIKILNGSDVKGEAAKVKAILEKDGYVVPSIGNAPVNNYQESVISIKKQVSNEFVSEIKTTLNSYTFSDKETELAENEDVDVVVTIVIRSQ